jgi:hypothetical protein
MDQAHARIPPEAMARFTAAEARLYPLAMVDADLYQRATALVGMLARDLRENCPDIEAVLGRRDLLLTLLPDQAALAGVSLAGLQADTVVDCASALRCREVQAQRAEASARARVDAARESGQEWVVEEPDPATVMAGVFRKVELHLPTGCIVVSSVEADSAGAPSEYRLELIPPRTDSGAIREGRSESYPDRASWALATERIRAELSSNPHP